MFYDQLSKACKEKGLGVTTLLRRMNISPGNATAWKNGVVPKSDMIDLLAKELDVSTDYLIREEDISIQVSDKSTSFKSLKAVPQRWLSIRPSKEITATQMQAIAGALHCEVFFFFDDSELEYEYIPSKEKMNADMLVEILDIMDTCAENEKHKRLQLQISRIVIYWLKKAGFDYDFLTSDKCNPLNPTKLDYICNGTKHIDSTLDYGFNFTDLCVIKDITGLSMTYLLTGKQ